MISNERANSTTVDASVPQQLTRDGDCLVPDGTGAVLLSSELDGDPLIAGVRPGPVS